jgi:hypothetical protein
MKATIVYYRTFKINFKTRSSRSHDVCCQWTKQLPCAPVLLLKIIIVQQNVSLGRICLKSAESNLIKNFLKKTLKSDLIVGTPHILETEYALCNLFYDLLFLC